MGDYVCGRGRESIVKNLWEFVSERGEGEKRGIKGME
jgi:hypothetical protein